MILVCIISFGLFAFIAEEAFRSCDSAKNNERQQIGKVGNDFFGDQLRAAIKEAGIDDIGLCTDEKIHTTLAMVHTYPDGDRDFSFYRNPRADMMLNKTEIPEDILKETEMQISKKL